MESSLSSESFTVSVSDTTTTTSQHMLPPVAGAAPSSTSSSSNAGMASQVVAVFKRSSHPTAAVFHVAFKTAALIFYLLSTTLFTDSFVIVFVTCVVLMAFDFWTVKNVTGRLLVGLRWWNDVADDGTSSWRYESIDDPTQVSRADYAIFWYSMYLFGLMWGLLAFFALLKLSVDYLLICGVSLVLIWSNVYGYWQCSKEARTRIEQGVQAAIAQGTIAALTGRWGNMMGGASTGGSTQGATKSAGMV